jgi:dUTP pyrophosphatase
MPLCLNVRPMAAGYDVFSAAHILIPPPTCSLIPLYIQIKPPPGSHVSKHWKDVKAGVIDPDYTGNVQVLLHNHSAELFEVKIGGRIAQLIIINIEMPSPTPVDIFEQPTGVIRDLVALVPVPLFVTPQNHHKTQTPHLQETLTSKKNHLAYLTYYMIYISHKIYLTLFLISISQLKVTTIL